MQTVKTQTKTYTNTHIPTQTHHTYTNTHTYTHTHTDIQKDGQTDAYRHVLHADTAPSALLLFWFVFIFELGCWQIVFHVLR